MIKMNNLDEKIYKEKYPEGYIQHYLAMFGAIQDNLLESNFESQNRMYLDNEGKEEFLELRNEVAKAKQQKDLNWFLQLAKFFEIENINLESLNKMFNSIEKFKF